MCSGNTHALPTININVYWQQIVFFFRSTCHETVFQDVFSILCLVAPGINDTQILAILMSRYKIAKIR